MSMTQKIIALAGVLLIAGAVATAEAAKKRVPSRAHEEAVETSELVKMLDIDKNGVVSKEEFMNFMSREFDRLDVNKNQQLEPSELSRAALGESCYRASPPPRCLR